VSRSSEEIDVGLLRVVRELSRQGTVTAAAAALGKSQSTLSHALDRLRRHYRDPLFVPAGARLAVEAERLLIDIDRVQTLAPSFDPKHTRYRFRVHMIDLAELLILPGLLRRLADSPSGVEIEVVRLAGQDVWSELELGRLDLVIGTPWKAHPTLLRQQILEEQFVGVARNQLGTLAGYLRCAHCAVMPRGPALSRIEAALEALSPSRRVLLRVPDYLSIPSLVSASDVVAAVPSTLVDLHPLGDKLLVFALPVTQARFKVVQHWHRRAHDDPACLWLRRTIHEVVKETAARWKGEEKSRRGE
jgi:DNA-binding transcriptional LysR family regulator